VIGAGCKTYAEAREDLPFDQLLLSPQEVVAYLDALDAGMHDACR
jgi:hypothetical protein